VAGDQQKFRIAMAHAEKFSQQKQWNEASRAYRFALAEFPNDESAIVGFGKATLYAGSAENAWKAFQQALRVNPANTQALGFMADIQSQMGQVGPASQTYTRIGDILFSKGEIPAAMRSWQRAIELVPGNPEAHLSLAKGLHQQGQIRLATKEFLVSAAIYQRLKNQPQARQQVQAAQSLLPDDPGVLAAIESIQQGRPIDPQKVSETPPIEFVEEVEEEEFEVEEEEEEVIEEEVEEEEVVEEVIEEEEEFEEEVVEEEEDLFSEESLGQLLGEEPVKEVVKETVKPKVVEKPKPPPEEDDFLGLGLDEELPDGGGLVEGAHQQALAELANVIFEDDQSGPDRFLAADGSEISRMEINMLIIQAIDLQTRGSIDEAIDRYRQVVQANAGRPSLYFNLGLLYKQREEFKEAVKMLRLASQDKNFKMSAQFALGQTYYVAQERETALRNFAEALKIIDLETVDEKRADELEAFYDNLADDYLAQGNLLKINVFVEALEKFFSFSSWAKKVKSARQRMDSIAEEDRTMSLAEFLESPETEVVITALATTGEYMKQSFFLSASEECLRAIQKAPSYLPLHTRLADILLKQDRTEKAVEKYLAIARVYEIRHQPEQCIGVFKKILRLAPMDLTVRAKLVDVYIARKNLDQALEHYMALADTYYQLAQVDEALTKYDEALALAKESDNSKEWKIKILNQQGDIYNQRFEWAKAMSLFEEAYKLDPHNERTCRQLIDLYYQQFKGPQAIKVVDGLLGVYQRKNPAKAVDILKELVAINPDEMDLRQRLAVAFVQVGRKKEAIAEYDTLGELQLNEGLRSQAEKTIQAILALKPDRPQQYQQLLSQIRSGAA